MKVDSLAKFPMERTIGKAQSFPSSGPIGPNGLKLNGWSSDQLLPTWWPEVYRILIDLSFRRETIDELVSVHMKDLNTT